MRRAAQRIVDHPSGVSENYTKACLMCSCVYMVITSCDDWPIKSAPTNCWAQTTCMGELVQIFAWRSSTGFSLVSGITFIRLQGQNNSEVALHGAIRSIWREAPRLAVTMVFARYQSIPNCHATIPLPITGIFSKRLSWSYCLLLFICISTVASTLFHVVVYTQRARSEACCSHARLAGALC